MANCSCPEPLRLLVTCEHAGNEVPEPYRFLFAGSEEVLRTHRGYDLHAMDLAGRLTRAFNVPLLAATVSRLLVDCNRTPMSRNLFSPYSRGLARRDKELIRATWHSPHQEEVAGTAKGFIAAGATVIHIAVHTFTPVLNGSVRTADIGLLYDPARSGERKLCRLWLDELRRMAPDLRLRRNYPYLGKSNCLAALLRNTFPAESYLGVEVEINQGTAETAGTASLARAISSSLAFALPALVSQLRVDKKFGGQKKRLSV